MSTIANLLIHLGVDADDVESGFAGASDAVDRHIGKIAAAGAVAGAAMEGFARSQQDSNVAFERMGRVTGKGSEAMRAMAGDLQDVTFPMEDVVALMETATQRGLEGDAIAEYASFWDMVGDATGEAGPKLGEAGVALGLVGIAAGEEAQALDAFGFITDQTTGSVEGFLGFIERTATELGDATPNIDDMAGALGALEDAGIGGQRAQRELRQALNKTDGDMVAALETLGVTEEAFLAQVDAVDGSSVAIEANAQAFADSFTPMQKLSASLENLMTKHGGLADAAGALALPLMALGPIMKGITTVIPAMIKGFAAISKGALVAVKAIGAKVVAWTVLGAKSLVAAAKVAMAWLIAMGPIALVIAAVVGLVVLIVKNWDTIVAATRKAWDWIVGKFRQATAWVSRMWSAMWSAIRGAADRAIAFVRGIPGRVLSGLAGFASTVASFIARWHPAAVLFRMVRSGLPAVLGFVRGIPRRILSSLGNMGNLLKGAGKALLRGLTSGIRSVAMAPVNAVKNVVGKVRNLLPFSPAKEGPLSGSGSPDIAGATLVDMIAGGMHSQIGGLAREADRVARAALPDLGVPSVDSFGTAGFNGATVGMSPRAMSARGSDQTIIIELDGREIGRGVAPHIVEETRVRTGVRR